jgi:hypothetical protein
MGLNDLAKLPETLKAVVERLNPQHYGKLHFETIDPPADQDLTELGNALDIMTLKWPDTPEHQVSAGSGVVGLVLRHGQRHVSLPVVQVFQLPIFGTQYQMAGEAELTGMIEDGVESLIDINADIGVLTGHGTLPLVAPPPQGRPEDADITAFRDLVSQNYTLKTVNPTDDGISGGFETLMILRPQEKLSDFALYQIDQFLMRGGNLFIVLDAFKEEFPAGAMPVYRPVDSGLEQMLAHWGVEIDASYVMDEHCYRQRLPQDMGGGEQIIHFAPLIENQNIHNELPFMRNIRGLVAFRASPLELDRQRLDDLKLSAAVLFSSSNRSWRMGEPINLNPMFSTPPPESEMEGPLPLAVLVEGEFSSYFDGKPMPVRPDKPASEATEEGQAGDPEPSAGVQGVADTGVFMARGRPAKIFVMASAEMLSDKILEPEGRSPNSIFILNTIDDLNGRQDVAILRSKEQRFNPLDPVTPETRGLVKAVNIAGLPILVVCFGLLVWLHRSRRKRRIQDLFRQEVAR